MEFEQDMPLLVTTAILGAAPNTVLGDPISRLQTTEYALSRIASLYPEQDVVVCDGSGYDLRPRLEGLGNKFEFLSFVNDSEKVQVIGKGYGEGEIIDYALEESNTLKNAGHFIKITGKLWVTNLPALIHGFNGHCGFSYHGFRSLKFMDTRFYIVAKEFFNEHLRDGYKSVDESQNKIIEEVYKSILQEFPVRDVLLKSSPRLFGTSGTTGRIEATGFLKNASKTVRHRASIHFNTYL